MPTRQFVDAPQSDRCAAVIRLKDGTTADCGRRATIGTLCTQHAKLAGIRPAPVPLD